MAYFQIDKNPKKKFLDPKIDRSKLTSEDYKDAADAFYTEYKRVLFVY